ncbi:hypothetical protein EJ06DRAFT_552994 [Trichodelitschia bisporula]|uniref:Ino eighty subunit 1 n=1 Tax=Trichodelitschia bisporula TaxID=703511 RepID=A0A6G1IBI9_9PEZI|nr:hypothetical protein EJ06DRAFT_552994 [Trichodelitschia bisporula]
MAHQSTTTTTRRNANGSVSSVYSGNKIRHLKKDDGMPLWRKDIQYDFLKMVFEDDKPVFHKASDGTGNHTFADIYLDSMAKSSKCSKILKDKLLTERPAALNMAMVCLLVNVGRMNTTLNFFPEMRAQLRTYHSIPSLQAHQDPNAYKQLQDAPRLKSILKGATEDVPQPSSIEEIQRAEIPRTNPVNLIFVLAQNAPKVSEMHFDVPRDFFDLVMKTNFSSGSRATAFLWLMWWYLESDFTSEAARNNPYGPGRTGGDPSAPPIKCPAFVELSTEEEAAENMDTKDELEFGELKRQERATILKSDMAPVVTGPKRGGKRSYTQNPVFSVMSDDASPARDFTSPAPSASTSRRSKALATALKTEHHSDTDRTRSASPDAHTPAKPAGMRVNTLLNDEAPKKGPGRGNWRRGTAEGGRSFGRFKADSLGEGAEGAEGAGRGPHGYYIAPNGAEQAHKRTRPLTSHQLALERYRKERVDYILDRGLREERDSARKKRHRDGPFLSTMIKYKNRPPGYDSEEDGPMEKLTGYGEEAESMASVLRKSLRRLERWEGNGEVVRKVVKEGAKEKGRGEEGEEENEGEDMDIDGESTESEMELMDQD